MSGVVGAFCGSPADVVLVRLQADGRQPPEKRRNYRHALDGLYRVAREEGRRAVVLAIGVAVVAY